MNEVIIGQRSGDDDEGANHETSVESRLNYREIKKKTPIFSFFYKKEIKILLFRKEYVRGFISK